MKGIVIAGQLIKDQLGHRIIDARIDDVVEGNGTTRATSLRRAGRLMWSGSGFMIWKDYVRTDEVTPPPDPTGFPEYFILTAPNGEQKRYNRV